MSRPRGLLSTMFARPACYADCEMQTTVNQQPTGPNEVQRTHKPEPVQSRTGIDLIPIGESPALVLAPPSSPMDVDMYDDQMSGVSSSAPTGMTFGPFL